MADNPLCYELVRGSVDGGAVPGSRRADGHHPREGLLAEEGRTVRASLEVDGEMVARRAGQQVQGGAFTLSWTATMTRRSKGSS